MYWWYLSSTANINSKISLPLGAVRHEHARSHAPAALPFAFFRLSNQDPTDLCLFLSFQLRIKGSGFFYSILFLDFLRFWWPF